MDPLVHILGAGLWSHTAPGRVHSQGGEISDSPGNLAAPGRAGQRHRSVWHRSCCRGGAALLVWDWEMSQVGTGHTQVLSPVWICGLCQELHEVGAVGNWH